MLRSKLVISKVRLSSRRRSPTRRSFLGLSTIGSCASVIGNVFGFICTTVAFSLINAAITLTTIF
ncbi:twin-arginine translocation signal domain-containing protein [bacterium]|nr:twin-arginine translocation signal domain-containing protein [bacterium]